MASRHLRRTLLPLWLLLCVVACHRATPDQLLADARAALASGELRTAEIHVKNLLQQQPDNVAGRVLLGQVALASGDFAGAEQNLARAVALGAQGTEVRLALARSLVAQRKFKEALEALASAPAADGADRAAALAIEAVAHRGLGEREEAEAAYRAALRIDPKSLPIRSDLAATLLEAGRADAARALVDEVLADEPKFVPALLLRGNLEIAAGQTDLAQATFQQAVDIERPNRGAAYSLALARLSEVQLAQGNVDAAATNADSLLASNPQNPVARYMKAAVEARQNSLDAAERRLESLIADFPAYWPAYRLLGGINVNQNQPEQATMYLRQAVTNDPTDSAARLQLAELYIRSGNLDAAKQLMAAATSSAPVSDGLFFAFAARTSQQAGLEEQAAQYFAQSERQVPDDVRQLAGVSSLYVSAGEFERAIRVLQSASFKDEQSERLRSYLLALVQARQGNLQAADATAQRLSEGEPKAAWPLNLRTAIAMLGADWSRAADFTAKALALEPRNTTALLNSARVAVAQGDPARSEQQLRVAVDIDPQSTPALLGLAQLTAARRDFTGARSWVARLPASPLRVRLEADVAAAEGKVDEAAVGYGRAYDAQPSAELAIRAYDAGRRAGRERPEEKLEAWAAAHPDDATSNFALGSVALTKGQQDEAARRYEAVLAKSPNHAATLNNLAWIYSERGDARALELAERASAAEPNNPSIADTLGWLYVRQGQAAKGLPLLEKAIGGLTDQAEVRYHWAVALAETGDSARAIENFEIAIRGAADFAGRGDAERRLAALRGSRP
jgi:putative PEP-CTERM system TPR-repeat lipoprotein